MASIGSQYSFGRRKPLSAFQRFEAWQQFRRSQLRRVQQNTQMFSSAFLQFQQRKIEDASIVAAKSALERMVAEHKAKAPTPLQEQLKRLLDKKV